MADWDERSERKRGGVADSAYAPTFTPPLVPGSHPVASNPSACRARATPRIGPAIPSSSSSSPSPPPLVRPRSLFLPSSSSTPRGRVHPREQSWPASQRQKVHSFRTTRHPAFPRSIYIYIYVYVHVYIHTFLHVSIHGNAARIFFFFSPPPPSLPHLPQFRIVNFRMPPVTVTVTATVTDGRAPLPSRDRIFLLLLLFARGAL